MPPLRKLFFAVAANPCYHRASLVMRQGCCLRHFRHVSIGFEAPKDALIASRLRGIRFSRRLGALAEDGVSEGSPRLIYTHRSP